MDEELLGASCARMEEAGLLLRQGFSRPRPTYLFKHALIQDAAYQSLLRSTRQRYHERIVQALTRRFPEIAETQPELLAHHYTGAGLAEQAVGNGQKARQPAVHRPLRLLRGHQPPHPRAGAAPPSFPPRAREGSAGDPLAVRADLGLALILATRGYATKDVEDVYVRARELCTQLRRHPPVRLLGHLGGFSLVRGDREGTERARPVLPPPARDEPNDPVDLCGGPPPRCSPTRSFWRGDYVERARHGKAAKVLVEARGFCAREILALLQGGNQGGAPSEWLQGPSPPNACYAIPSTSSCEGQSKTGAT